MRLGPIIGERGSLRSMEGDVVLLRKAGNREDERADAVRAVAALRVAWGVLLVCPRRGPLRRFAAEPGSSAPRTVGVLLGARQVVQGVVTATRPTSPVPAGGVVVDVLHAASMLGLAAVDRRSRRWALRSAAAAFAWAAAGGVAGRS